MREFTNGAIIRENLISANKEPMKELESDPIYVKFVNDVSRDLLGFSPNEQNEILRLLKMRSLEERGLSATRLYEQGKNLIEEAEYIKKSCDEIKTL